MIKSFKSKKKLLQVQTIRNRRAIALAVVAIMAMFGVYAVFVSHAAVKITRVESYKIPPFGVDDPTHGIVWKGFLQAKTGPCAGRLELEGAPGQCSHGPDPSPYPLVKATAKSPASTSVALADSTYTFPCIGNGSDGQRVQVLFIHPTSYSGSLTAMRPVILRNVGQADGMFTASAAKGGSGRRMRLVTDATCTPTIIEVPMPATNFSTFAGSVSYLLDHGYNLTTRKYIVIGDSDQPDGVCGTASDRGYRNPGGDPPVGSFDDSATPNNANNLGPSFARSDKGCLDHVPKSVLAHEIGHLMGAVIQTAPHYSDDGHCYDSQDIMCVVSDGTHSYTYPCPELGNLSLLDCNGDDYFNAGVVPTGTWLATHWNAANSAFLQPGPLPTTARQTITGIAPPGGVLGDVLYLTHGPGLVTFKLETLIPLQPVKIEVFHYPLRDPSIGGGPTFVDFTRQGSSPLTFSLPLNAGLPHQIIVYGTLGGPYTLSIDAPPN